PVVAVGTGVPASGAVVLVDGSGGHFAFRVAGRAVAFPGMSAGQPMIVSERSVMAARMPSAQPQLWSRGDPADVVPLVRTSHLPVTNIATVRGVKGTLGFAAVGWAFGFLRSLGIVTGLVSVAVAMLYLAARQRSREVSYALARRMGLRRGAHRLSVAIELGGMVAAGFVIGSAVGWVAVRIVLRWLDP